MLEYQLLWCQKSHRGFASSLAAFPLRSKDSQCVLYQEWAKGNSLSLLNDFSTQIQYCHWQKNINFYLLTLVLENSLLSLIRCILRRIYMTLTWKFLRDNPIDRALFLFQKPLVFLFYFLTEVFFLLRNN